METYLRLEKNFTIKRGLKMILLNTFWVWLIKCDLYKYYTNIFCCKKKNVNAMQFHNTFILKLQYICCNVYFLDVVKLQYICSNFTTLYFKDTFSCIVKLHCVLAIKFHYIYCKITIEIWNMSTCSTFMLNAWAACLDFFIIQMQLVATATRFY